MHQEHVLKTIEMLQEQIQRAGQEVAEKRRTVNSLCTAIGRAAVYANSEPAAGKCLSIRSDEFYGKPLATAVRAILEKRAGAGLGSASVYEIYDRMVEGGFRFGTRNEGHARRGLAISLAKNTGTFHRLPNGDFGLTEWYPEAAREKNGNKEGIGHAEEVEEEPYHNEFADEEQKVSPLLGEEITDDAAEAAARSAGQRAKKAGSRAEQRG